MSAVATDERCIHWMLKVTCGVCNAKAIKQKQQVARVETRSLARTAKCQELVGELDFDVLTLGFLAARGYLYFSMPESQHEAFVSDYMKLAGNHPDDHGEYRLVDSTVSQWAIAGRIEFRYDERADLDVDFGDFKICDADGRWYLANTAFCWVLVALGFKLGRQDVDRVRLRLEKDVDKFDAGVLLGQRK